MLDPTTSHVWNNLVVPRMKFLLLDQIVVLKSDWISFFILGSAQICLQNTTEKNSNRARQQERLVAVRQIKQRNFNLV
jgi:hypothetical protein